MYVDTPRWVGTSPVVRLRSAAKIRGLGLIDYTAVDPSGSTPCSQVAVPAGFTGPVNCTPDTAGGVNYGASQSQLADAYAQLQAQIAALRNPAESAINWGTVALVAGGGLLFVTLLGRSLR